MTNLYMIHAFENQYSGLHGREDFCVKTYDGGHCFMCDEAIVPELAHDVEEKLLGWVAKGIGDKGNEKHTEEREEMDELEAAMMCF